jgi:hypothetical protein
LNWGELKNQVRALLNQLSNRGALLPTTKVADLLKKIEYFINPVLYDLASTTGKIPEVFYITHNPAYNELARDTSSIKKYLPGQDFSIELVGARSCFFEATGPATILIEERNNGEWSALETISIPSTQKTFAEYKRLINPTQPGNNVRLRFAGSFPYDYRNYILYPYTWPTAEDIQQHRPHFIYPLPSDFLKLNNVMVKKDQRQYTPYVAYVMTPDKKMALNRYEVGEYLINYYRKPKLLTFTGDDAVDNLQTVDATDDAVQIAALSVAAQALLSEKDETAGLTLMNEYEAKKGQLTAADQNYSSVVYNVYGW